MGNTWGLYCFSQRWVSLNDPKSSTGLDGRDTAACQSYSVEGLERKKAHSLARKTGWSLSSYCLFWSLARGMCTTRGLRGEKAWLNPVCMVFQ